MISLRHLLEPGRREAVVTDLAAVIDSDVAEKKGLSGTADQGRLQRRQQVAGPGSARHRQAAARVRDRAVTVLGFASRRHPFGDHLAANSDAAAGGPAGNHRRARRKREGAARQGLQTPCAARPRECRRRTPRVGAAIEEPEARKERNAGDWFTGISFISGPQVAEVRNEQQTHHDADERSASPAGATFAHGPR